MRVKSFTSADMGENCYIVSGDDKEAVVIDPGNSAEKILDYIKKEELDVKAVLQTHAHFDHMCSAAAVKAATGAAIYVAEPEAVVASDTGRNLSAMFGTPEAYAYDEVLSDGDTFEFGGTECRLILTPGHTVGSCCYYFEQEGALFSGDTLFQGSVGRTDFPTGDDESLRKSIIAKLFILPEGVRVFSGHGPSTTIGYEKENNMYVF